MLAGPLRLRLAERSEIAVEMVGQSGVILRLPVPEEKKLHGTKYTRRIKKGAPVGAPPKNKLTW
ncbi:hypothetical protein CCAX7_65400 [Capsulimonas corticalis]|uniref:Uncharacterized protein n=1 Tax=Capsulimonas corticalis TaxID=2219043 RepID=A0A402CR51_9BACT|nr:hypothetical protein CCAX7_65400 [Capsulimonas corticalis]